MDHRQVGGGSPDIVVARVVAVSRCARTQVAGPLHAHRILMIWHAESLGMSRSDVYGVASSVGEDGVKGVVFSCGATPRGRGLSLPVGDVPRVRGQESGPRRRRLSPFGRTRTRPCSPVLTASNAPGPTDCHVEAAVGAEPGRATTRARTVTVRALGLERVTGIEPALSAWEAEVLPLNYTRVAPVDVCPRCVRKSNPDSGRLRKSACAGVSRTASATPLPTTLANGFPDVFIGVMSA